MEIPFGTLYELKIQHIEFFAVCLCHFLQIVFLKQLLADVPYLSKILEVQCHSVVEKQRTFMLLDFCERSVKLIALQGVYKFLHTAA